MASTRCGTSVKQLQRETVVTYKTAWRMFNQIRTILGDNDNLEGSSVDVDETYIDGRRRGKRGRAAERKGRVLAQKVPDVKAKTLVPFVEMTVAPKSVVYTDALPSYDILDHKGYTHKRVPHALKVYVIGDIHMRRFGVW